MGSEAASRTTHLLHEVYKQSLDILIVGLLGYIHQPFEVLWEGAWFPCLLSERGWGWETTPFHLPSIK